jgi:Spy/CpxP family protein refolding chaperone
MKRFSAPRIVLFSMLALALCLANFVQASAQVDLNLTDEQIAALKELRVETRGKIKPLVKEMLELRVQMEETILAGEIDTDKLSEQIERIIEIKSQITEITVDAKLEAAKIITPEQAEIHLEQIEEARKKIKEKRKELRKELNKNLKELRDFLPKLTLN